MKTIKELFSNPATWIVSVVAVALIAGLTVRQFAWTEIVVPGESDRSFTLPIDYDRFRQILVRTDVTKEIVNASGQSLKQDSLQALELDTTNDDRPILNALLGKSKTEVQAEKHLVVSVKNTEIDLEELAITQHANLGNDETTVQTTSDKPTGKLESYNTVLSARRASNATEVKVSVDLKVMVNVPRIFQTVAQQKVQAASDKIATELEAMLKEIVAKHASEERIRIAR
jgi:hypothetical protein